jgi:hypothetical protein
LIIYRKYYGTKMMLFIAGSFYLTMVAAGYIVELFFNGLGLEPTVRNARVGEMAIHWNYTSVLNIVAILVAAGLIVRFVRSGGMPMLKMMGGESDTEHDHEHHHH